MMHCYRLVQMAREIAEGKGVIVRLLSWYLLEEVELNLTLIDLLKVRYRWYAICKKSNLPDFVQI
jgi:hypothetical protein